MAVLVFGSVLIGALNVAITAGVHPQGSGGTNAAATRGAPAQSGVALHTTPAGRPAGGWRLPGPGPVHLRLPALPTPPVPPEISIPTNPEAPVPILQVPLRHLRSAVGQLAHDGSGRAPAPAAAPAPVPKGPPAGSGPGATSSIPVLRSQPAIVLTPATVPERPAALISISPASTLGSPNRLVSISTGTRSFLPTNLVSTPARTLGSLTIQAPSRDRTVQRTSSSSGGFDPSLVGGLGGGLGW